MKKIHCFFITSTFFIILTISLCIIFFYSNHSNYVVGSAANLTYPPPSTEFNKNLISESVMDIINTENDAVVEIYLTPINEHDVFQNVRYQGKTAEEWRQLLFSDTIPMDAYEKATQAIKKYRQALCVAEVGYSAEYIDDYYMRIQIPASEILELTKKDLIFVFCTEEEYQNSLNSPPCLPCHRGRSETTMLQFAV